MIELEQDHCTKDGGDERNTIVHEYEVVVESLLRDLETCKGEQMRLRSELETLRRESKAAGEMARESFARSNVERCSGNQDYEETLGNLQKRLSIVEKEKESVFQLWQMSLKAVDTLEQELKATQKDDRASKYYEEQVNGVKETYSEAIKVLEAKLLQAKENFVKHQSLWESSRERIENLSREKNELERKLHDSQSEAQSKEETNRREIASLRCELEASRTELERTRGVKLELQERFLRLAAKDEESKSKILEAIELVETAVKEKDNALQREARALEDSAQLESRLNRLVDDYTARLDKELAAARESLAANSKKYIVEIKELKAELREKATLLDRAQRETRLMEDELDKVRHGSEDFLQRSHANVLELEAKLKESQLKNETCDENCRRKCEEKTRQSDERIAELEARLAAYGDRLRRTQLHSSKEFDERIREADDRTKEVLERYSSLERRLARALDERENLSCELRTLQSSYDREIARRDNERRMQEARIRELQDDLQNANNTLEKANARGTLLMKQVANLQQDMQNKQQSTNVNGNEIQASNAELMLRLKTLQEKFDHRTKELSQHVETHQKLCTRWKDEAKSLTTKFQLRSKELRDKMAILRKENEELNKELLVCRQQLAHCRVQVLHRSAATLGPGTMFGTSTPAASGSLTFGTPAATAAPAASVPAPNFSFGAATTTATPSQSSSLLLGPSTATTAPSLFGTPAASSAAPTTGLTFGTLSTSTGSAFGATASAPATGGALNFGAPTTSSSSLFGTGTGGLFGAKPTTTVATANTTSTNKGLGGLDVSVSNKGLSHGSNSPTVAKENLIPNELTQTIDNFKEFVKTQKGFSSDIARGSARPLNRCAEDTASLMEMLTTLAGSVQRDRSLADKLKQDTAKALQNAEIAQRTHDTPAGLQYENNAPLHFFMELAESFEHEIMLFRSQIEATEKHIQTMMAPRALTPQELTAAMSKIHESLVAVAGRLQGVHAKVQQQKEQYLNFRKYVLKDSSNVFEDVSKINGKSGRSSIGRITSGPTPFGPGNKSFLSSTAINTGRPPSYGTQNPLAWGNSTPVPSATNITIGASMKPPTASLNFNPPINLTAPLSSNDSNSSFQLQKPPVGNKRGKH